MVALFLLAGCGSEDGAGSGGPDGSPGGGATDGGGAGADGAPADGGPGNGDGDHSGSDGGGSSEEVCNGVDDDGDGIIDNVDRGDDGICDCLRIGTLGIPGKWGEGDVFRDWLEGKSDSGATHLTPLVMRDGGRTGDDQPITRELLEPLQVLVVQDVSVLDAFTSNELDALEGWIRDGGGMMTLIGYADPDERMHVNEILDRFGLAYGATQILQKSGGQTIPVTQWDSHPTTEGIERVGVDNGYPILPDAAATVVAREGGHDVALAKQVGEGRVFMWGDEWITYNSEWNEGDYQVERFWLNVIKWLTPDEECKVDIPPLI
jgi:hypothetical protein